jgi:putative peptidoglycan lipid II flippase
MNSADAAEPPPARPPSAAPPDQQRSIVRAATLTSLGSLSSRVVGLLRETVKSFFFGNGQAASAYELASNLPSSFYDLLVGGMLSSALVPTLSRLAANEGDDETRRREFGSLLGALIGLAMLVLFVVTGVLWIAAYPIAVFRGGANQDAAQLASLLRITIPAILFMNLSGLLTAALQARRRFGFTAFTATVFNLSMIACMVLFERWLGVTALAIGMLVGSIAQVLLQLPGLRGVPIRVSLNWRHPGVSQIVRLFLPVAGGLVLSIIAAEVSYIASSQISAEGPSTMRYAAQVIQFPLGMIVSAVSIATLPALSSASGESFKSTLASGLRLMIVLIAPASVGLFLLARPVIALLFQHGAFDAAATADTAAALRSAVPNLLFAALDVPFIYAFYALRDTRTPTFVGLVSTLSYGAILAIMALLDRAGLPVFTLNNLILANSIKTGIDAALMGPLLWRKVGGLSGYGVSRLAARVLAATIACGVVIWAANMLLEAQFGLASLPARLIVLAGSASAGAAVYLALARLFGIAELTRFLRRGKSQQS